MIKYYISSHLFIYFWRVNEMNVPTFQSFWAYGDKRLCNLSSYKFHTRKCECWLTKDIILFGIFFGMIPTASIRMKNMFTTRYRVTSTIACLDITFWVVLLHLSYTRISKFFFRISNFDPKFPQQWWECSYGCMPPFENLKRKKEKVFILPQTLAYS